MLPVTNRKHITVLSFELKCKAATFPGSSNVSLAPCFHVSRALPDKHTCAVEKAERAAATTQYDISLLRARSEQLGWRWAANRLTGVQQNYSQPYESVWHFKWAHTCCTHSMQTHCVSAQSIGPAALKLLAGLNSLWPLHQQSGGLCANVVSDQPSLSTHFPFAETPIGWHSTSSFTQTTGWIPN